MVWHPATNHPKGATLVWMWSPNRHAPIAGRFTPIGGLQIPVWEHLVEELGMHYSPVPAPVLWSPREEGDAPPPHNYAVLA